ncbi:MAG: hypothetical protein IT372_07120 [Polyangiaceae bacterium]|nr:hypothetical protein [Polyangiaceae bacterium]
MPPPLPRRALPLFALLALAACGSDPSPATPSAAATKVPLPASAAPGDEIVARITPRSVGGDWRDEADAGAVIELALGANLARHAIFPGGSAPVLRVSLGAWDGGELLATTVAGTIDAAIEAEVDPAAAGTPILGLYDARFWNDAPLLSYVDGDEVTYVMTNEDGGTGLFPTLLMAQWGRPVDIEALYVGGESPTIQTTDHAWVPFEGPYEGGHPRLRIVTQNGLVGPGDGEAELSEPVTYRASPVSTGFDPAGVPRERALDEAPWVLAAGFAEFERQGQLVADGGQEDGFAGAPGDYVFIDYSFDSADGAELSFEAEVDGVRWSSLNGWTEPGGLTDAFASGIGRTCVELPPGRSAADVTSLHAVVHGSGSGTLEWARWFSYDEALAPVEIGELAAPAGGAAGGEILLQ